MAQIRPMEERDSERVRDLWLQMCAEAGTPLSAASSQLILANLRQYEAVTFLQARGAGSIHTRICVGKECPEEGELRSFWNLLGWENDMTLYSIYSNVPGDPVLQRIWDEYQAHT